MNIYISNLDTQVTNEELKALFAPHGTVASAEIAMDAFTESSRGFGNVEMTDDAQAQAAITALNGTSFRGKTITVQQAEPKDVRKGSYKVGNGAVNAYQFRKN